MRSIATKENELPARLQMSEREPEEPETEANLFAGKGVGPA